MVYNIYPAVDENYVFPLVVRQAMAGSAEIGIVVNAKIDAKLTPAVEEQNAKREELEAKVVKKTDPLAPVATSDIPGYASVNTDPVGRLSQGTLTDGTIYTPHEKIDRLMLGDELVSEILPPGDFLEQKTDASGRILWAVYPDGTYYFPNLKVDYLNEAGAGGSIATATYVIPILGQSNALWKWYSASTVIVREVDSRVKVWNVASNTATPVPNSHGESLGLAFAFEFARQNPTATVIAVPTAVGSSGFTPNANGTWDHTSSALPNLYLDAVDRVKNAVAVTNGVLLAALWSQGENDRSSMTEESYATALTALINKFREDVGVADLPFILGSMTPEEIANVATSAAINSAHIDIPRRVLRTALISGPKDYGTFGEQIHYSPEGNAVRGKLFATEGLYRARLNVLGKNPISPNGIQIQRSGTTAVISWNPPPCRYTDFKLEISTDYGSTWSLQTLTDRIGLSHNLTGLTATNPLWARMWTINETGSSAKTLEVKV